MKIAILSQWWIHNQFIGGTERFINDFTKIATAQGHIVDVFMVSGPNHKNKYAHYYNIGIFDHKEILDEYKLESVIKLKKITDYRLLAKKIENAINLDNYDLIIANSLMFAFVFAHQQRIFIHHDNFFDKKNCSNLDAQIVKTQIHNPKTIFIAPSEFYKQQWDKLVGFGTIKINHAVFKNNLVTRKTKKTIASEYNLNMSQIHILLPSRLDMYQKNPEAAISIVSKLPPSVKNNITVIFTGLDQQYRKYIPKLSALAETADVKSQFIQFNNISEAYKVSDIIMIPSRYESFGYSAVESLWLGKPTVLSSIPSFLEIAKNARGCYLFKDHAHGAEIIKEIIAQKKWHFKQTNEWTNRYSPVKWINKYLTLSKLEVRELYDSNRRKTGEIIRKGEEIPTGRYYITVVIWIEDQFGNFLIQKNKKYNLWSTTGGHPKYKETSPEGIQTEVEEELGLKIKKKHLTLFKTLKTEDDFIDLYYIKIPHTQKFYLQKDEVDAIKWANISEIKDLIKQKLFLPPHIDFLKELIEWKKNGR